MKLMTIKLLSRIIKINRIEDDISQLEPRLCGISLTIKQEIYIDGSRPFTTLLHEIGHQYMTLTGRIENCQFNVEEFCDTYGFLIEQLMIENGDDIIKKLKIFAEGK